MNTPLQIKGNIAREIGSKGVLKIPSTKSLGRPWGFVPACLRTAKVRKHNKKLVDAWYEKFEEYWDKETKRLMAMTQEERDRENHGRSADLELAFHHARIAELEKCFNNDDQIISDT